MTEVNGQTTEYRYDGRDRVAEITYLADGSTQIFSYGLNGELQVKTDEDGVPRTYVYESTNGRLFQTIDAEDNYIQYTYDDQGNKVGQSYHRPGGETTSEKEWNYADSDVPGLLGKETLADDTFTEYHHDASGRLSSVTDPAGNIVSYTYDAYNRLSEVTEPGGGVTRYEYDLHGNLASVTDAENHTTTYVYDDMGRVVTVDSPDSGLTRYVYDPAGNRIERTDANGITKISTYDDLNRITAEVFPDWSDNVTYLYDQGVYGAGKLTGIVDASGSTAFSFDGRGRMVEKTSTVFGTDYVLSRILTPAGRTAQLTYPSGRTVNFERNACACAVDRISTTYDAITKVLVDNITSRPFGAADSMASGSGGVVENEHDPVGRLKTANPGAERERQYTYDARGNHTGIHTPSTPWLNEDFTYDSLNRLELGTGPYGTFTYTYDKVGNRQSLTGWGVPETYHYMPGTNRLGYIEKYGQTVYSYDAAGNVTCIGARTFVYNQNNRLKRVVDNGVLLGEYTHNAMGQRVVKTVNAVDTVFLYGFDDKLIVESRSNGVFVAEYIHRGDNVIAKVECATNTIYHYLNDYLGQPKALVDDQEQAVWEANYLPFGQAIVNPNSSVENNLRLLGQYYDQESGLHYNYYRYYNTATGRYITPDPIGNFGGINLFVYAQNNPINLSDPTGEFAITGTVALAFLAGKAIGIGVAWVGLQTATYAIGDPVLPSDNPCEKYHLSDYMNDVTGGIAVLNAGLGVGIAGGEIAAAMYPELMVATGTPQGQKILSNATDFISSAVPSTAPKSNLPGLAGHIAGEAYNAISK